MREPQHRRSVNYELQKGSKTNEKLIMIPLKMLIAQLLITRGLLTREREGLPFKNACDIGPNVKSPFSSLAASRSAGLYDKTPRKSCRRFFVPFQHPVARHGWCHKKRFLSSDVLIREQLNHSN